MYTLRPIDRRYPDRFSPRTVLCGALASAFFVTNVAFAHTAECNFWSDRRRSASHARTGTLMAGVPALRLPAIGTAAKLIPAPEPQLPEQIRKTLSPSFLEAQDDLLKCLPYGDGSVRKISTPFRFSLRGPVVIHIQDVHQNQEAQRHIALAVASLASRVDVIGLEGSTRTIDLERFRDFPDRNAVSLAAQESLAQNEITGPIHAALTSINPFPAVVGIDDPLHYAANIEAYRRSADRVAAEKVKLTSLKNLNENEKRRSLNPALHAFDRTVSDYREGRMSLSSYLKTLTSRATHLSPGLLRFKEALALEEQLDFRAVEADRARTVEILAARLDADSVAQLTAQGAAQRAGNIRYGDFYRFLKNLCARHGVRFGKELDAYVRYVLLADSLDPETLYDEMKAFEKSVFKRLTKTPAEAALLDRSQQLYLSEKLVAFSLTPDEWKEHQSNPMGGLGSFESFYREAHARDSAMAANLLSAMEKFNRQIPPDPAFLPPLEKGGQGGFPSSVALLVTGGYHAPGLADLLTKAGATVISFVPKIEKVDTADGQIALGIFTQEKTPLQKLFEGEKLFLGKNPLDTAIEHLDLPAKIVVSSNVGPDSALKLLMPKAVLEKIVSINKRANTLKLQMELGTFSVSWNPEAPIGHQLTTAVVMVSAAATIWASIKTGLYWLALNPSPWVGLANPLFQLGFLSLLVLPFLYFWRNHLDRNGQKTKYLNASPSGFSGIYLGSIFVGAIGLTFLTASFIDWETSNKWNASILVLLMFLLNFGKADGLASKLFNPTLTLIPELDFGNELPAKHKAIVYYPILFRNESDLVFFDENLLPSIEQNPDTNLTWVVMSTSDSPLREKELKKIRDLQNRFGENRILYFHREPGIKNWELKRGGYMHFLHWLRQNRNADGSIHPDPRFPAMPTGKVFDQVLGDRSRLDETAYFLISDSDFIWPAGTVRRMIGKMAHPANSGFGIFQAHSQHHNTNASFFTMLGGMTPTSLLQRTRNWGMLGQVNFSGSGAGIRIDRFMDDIAGKMRDGFLSHDLVESYFSRTAFIQDVITLGETPVNLMLRLRQWERWWRGNKIAFHLFRSHIKNEALARVPNPGTGVNKYLLYQSSRFYLGTFLSFTLLILLFFTPVHFTSAGWTHWTILALFFYETLFFELYHARGARERLGLVIKTLASFFLNPPVVFEVFRIVVGSYWEDFIAKITGNEKRFTWVPQGSLTTDRTLGTCFRIFWMATTVGITISALAIFGPVSPFYLLFFGPLALTPFLAWITAFPLDIFSYNPIGLWLKGRVLSVKFSVTVVALLTSLMWSSHTHGEEELIFDSPPWRVLGAQDSGPSAKSIRTPRGNFSELKILRDRDQIGSVKGNGYYRVTPPGTVWGSSFVTPGYWVNGRYYHKCEITDLSFSLDATKRLKLLGRINAPHLTSDDFTILFLQGDAKEVEIRVSFTVKTKTAVSFDPERNMHGESFKPFQFSSMNVGVDWDADKAVAVTKSHREESRLDRANSFVFKKPVPVTEDTEISLTNDRSDRPRNTPTTYVRLAGQNPSLFAVGWVATSKDPNDDNVGVWLGRGPQTVGMSVGYVARDSYKKGETVGQFNFIAGALPPATSLTAKPISPMLVVNVDSYERARWNIDSMKTFIRAYIESRGFSVVNEGWLSGIAQFYSLPVDGRRPFSQLINELNPTKLKELTTQGYIRQKLPGASLSTPWRNLALLTGGVLSISTAWAGEIGGSVAWWVFVTNGLIPVIILLAVLFSWRVLSSWFGQETSVPSVKEMAEREAQNTTRVSGISNAWPYQGSLQMRQSDAIRCLRLMNGSLASSTFLETYGMALVARRSEFPRFDGPTDVFNRFLWSLTGGVPDSTKATVPLDIISGNDLAGVSRMLNHLDFINQASKTPIQIVFAGETLEDVKKLQALKLNGPRGYVHVVDVPVAPKGVLVPHVLSQGIERLADFPTNVPVSWVLAVSPKISISPSTLGELVDHGLDGSLKEALASYIAQLIGGRLKPVDLDTVVDIVALVWQSA